MKVALREPSRADRILIRHMMELYLHDLSEFDHSDVDEHGMFVYGDLDYFWFEPTHKAFLITADEGIAGFVLVDNEVYLDSSERSITEFFILRKFRKQKIGQQAATEVFRRLPAAWEVRVMQSNLPAQAFRRTTIAEYTGGNLQEIIMDNEDWTGPVFSFSNTYTELH